jgi:hypothetical protein
MKKIFLTICGILFFGMLQAQLLDTLPEFSPEYFKKKFRIGVAFNQSFSGIIGSDLPQDYFIKPSLGGGIEAEYYFSNHIGIGTGFLFQQRGPGIYNPDVVKEVGDPDSTHRQRLRFNCLDLPIRLVFRSNKGMTKGNRWSGSIGVIPMYSFATNSVFHSIEDGFHQIDDWSADFKRFDLEISGSFGLNINAGDAALLQVQMYATYGLLNTYNNSTLFGNARGNHLLFGLKLATLF